ncbi:ATP-binding protein of ABC transporter [Crocosphaera subtropica ATCC 51142]|uniref:ATP-binding protein of ABC transporter n=1 Tax=Crocosphaera subtropica (strain ATCC 51142 / BH68) TaxID=43989 RepID=B1WRV6_CROS5|nr:ATP-binding cassette domain-containing protein [Crocosphaera subtropica]ACB53547.1 ATP-binding protein of ABC transporter [Crocosphaera subtropica ATCC 51142]
MTHFSGSKTILSQVPSLTLRNQQGQILGPFELTKDVHHLGRNPDKADLIVPENNNWMMVSGCQASFIKEGNDYRIYDGDQVKPSSNRLFLNNTLITPKEGLLLQDGMEITIGTVMGNHIIITYSNSNSNQPLKPVNKTSISLKNKSVVIGRDTQANLRLDAPTVSRYHAIIDTNNQGEYILTDRSTNGVFVNGQKVTGQAILSNGSTIRIGPYTLILQGDDLLIADTGDNIRLDAKNLSRTVQDKHGKKITLLTDISLPINPGQFVVIVGGSGAGKSTLMRTLLGLEPVDSGIVELNGEDLRKNFNIYRNLIGYVPQYDIVHSNLTVKEVLDYAAKLRLPADINLEQEREKVLKQIDLKERENTLVKNLSGGQLKRVSMGVELLADPKLFFLDEPTSGLDPGLDKKMMELLDHLSKEGRTIILVTHTTLNINLCDRLVFLGKGGNLCYFGPPQEAMTFFGVKSNNFADIYVHLEDKNKVKEEANRFKNDPNFHDKYIAQYLVQLSTPTHQKSKPKKVKSSFLQQFSILSQRYGQLWLRDPLNISLTLMTAPLGILAMRIALSETIPFNLSNENDPTFATLSLKVLFVFTCAAIWVGLATSLQEIVKESKIYQRERLVNLGIWAYLGSKASILGILGFLQSLLISLTIFISFKAPESNQLAWILGTEITIFLTLFSTIALGIMVSAFVKNITQANSSLPLLLLPEIIFSGVLFKMTGVGKLLSWLMISRWSVGALGSLVNIPSMIPEAKPISPLNPNPVVVPVDIPTEVYAADSSNLLINWGLLLLHSFIYWCVTYILQKRKDIL